MPATVPRGHRQRSTFELRPPRHFIYPALLLLLSEKPSNGYRLMVPLHELGYGAIDRPTVYRALADLEHDGLLASWDAEPKAGSTRHVYAVTSSGREQLAAWMAVLARERDNIDGLLRRHIALGTGPLIPLWAQSARDAAAGPPVYSPAQPNEGTTALPASTRPLVSFNVMPARSAVLVRARSTVGPIEFGTTGIRGSLRVAVDSSRIYTDQAADGRLAIDVATLTSGNALYDAELLRRVDARLFPTALVELDQADPSPTEDRFRLTGRLTFHGVTRTLQGMVGVSLIDERTLVVTGEETIDIRDFEISSPTMLMLKIYPDVRVFLHLEAEIASSPEP